MMKRRSAVPSGLGACRVKPGVETPGYCRASLWDGDGALDEQLGTAEGAGERGQRLDGRRQLRQRIAGELVEVHELTCAPASARR